MRKIPKFKILQIFFRRVIMFQANLDFVQNCSTCITIDKLKKKRNFVYIIATLKMSWLSRNLKPGVRRRRLQIKTCKEPVVNYLYIDVGLNDCYRMLKLFSRLCFPHSSLNDPIPIFVLLSIQKISQFLNYLKNYNCYKHFKHFYKL